MAEEVTHRALAAEAYNGAWVLLETDRTEDEDLELLERAFASRYLWRTAGGPKQWSIADWMVSRCFSVLGHPSLALQFASSAMRNQPEDAPAWMRASLYEGFARAHAANGDAPAREEAMRLAQAALDEEQNPEERAVIAEQLASVPPATG